MSVKQKKKRGRPLGWRKPNALREMVVVRMDAKTMAKLRAIAKRKRCKVSDAVRALVEGYGRG